MKYFNSKFFEFFNELSKNNSKAWFDENRKTYEKEVKKPFSKLVEDMIQKIQKHEDIDIKPSEAIMRINNDIRFSKDKTLYKTSVSANISKFGKKDKSYPGFYFQLSNDNISVYGGVYVLSTSQLKSERNHISNNLKDFQSIYSDARFIKYYKDIKGEKHKRIPKEFQSTFEKEPLIANKQFYYVAELDRELITSDSLAKKLMEYYKVGIDLNRFLQEGM